MPAHPGHAALRAGPGRTVPVGRRAAKPVFAGLPVVRRRGRAAFRIAASGQVRTHMVETFSNRRFEAHSLRSRAARRHPSRSLQSPPRSPLGPRRARSKVTGTWPLRARWSTGAIWKTPSASPFSEMDQDRIRRFRVGRWIGPGISSVSHHEGCQTPADRPRPRRFAVGFAEPCPADHRPAKQELARPRRYQALRAFICLAHWRINSINECLGLIAIGISVIFSVAIHRDSKLRKFRNVSFGDGPGQHHGIPCCA